MSLVAFYDELIARSEPRPRTTPASSELAALYGVSLGAELAAWVDVFATHEPRDRFGGLGWFGGHGGFTQDWLPGAGCDHGGNTYFATLFGDGGVSEIYWHDQDNDVVRMVAD